MEKAIIALCTDVASAADDWEWDFMSFNMHSIFHETNVNTENKLVWNRLRESAYEIEKYEGWKKAEQFPFYAVLWRTTNNSVQLS